MRCRHIELKPGADLVGFRNATRALIAEEVSPGEVIWSSSDVPSLLAAASPGDAPPLSLPRAAAEMIDLVVCHSEPGRYAQLYTLVWRLLHGERHVLEVHSDPLVHALEMKCKAVRRDLHKMHAFLRFRRVDDDKAGERFIAWFEPDHYIVEATAGFFVDRFGSLAWSILTPKGSLHWNRERLAHGPPATRGDAPAHDTFESGWKTYYESTFNPARVNTRAMQAHMPKKYWRNMAEAASIPALVEAAPARVKDMIEREALQARKRDPLKAVAAMGNADPRTLEELNAIISASSPLVPGATRAVLGEGPLDAAIAFVGEQPGDQEDEQGRCFIGPAGQLLDKALARAGIDRSKAYLTNAVKHFKFELRGKRRIHQKPTTGEVKHYRWWLMKELELVRPQLVVALGGTAAMALAGKALPVTRFRGPTEFEGRAGFITVHPSYLLRLPDADAKELGYRSFVADLTRVATIAANARGTVSA